MRKSDFNFNLPTELIAQEPPVERGTSRLLQLDRNSGALQDRLFADLPQLLKADDMLVINDTRVLPARLHGIKDSGGRIEILVERVEGVHHFIAQCRSSKPPRPGQKLILEGNAKMRVVGRRGEFYELETEGPESVIQLLDRIGHMPLPPYIGRDDQPQDHERYQTVYAVQPGAVAAPTAGLHFDARLLDLLRARGIEIVPVTLHVGAGTFQPLRVDDVRAHRMHRERIDIGADSARRINAAKAAGRRIVAVGTTVVRVLESMAHASRGREGVESGSGETDIFIFPGYRFRVVDGLITNFHLPESTLLMLVCAFAGTESVLAAYRHAIEKRYRFFSYGDAMLVLPAV